MNDRRMFLAAVFVVAFAACASAHTTSQAMPGQQPLRYPRLLVAALTPDLSYRLAAESSFVRVGADLGVEVVAYHTVFLVGRQYDDSEIVSELRRREIPAILAVSDATTDPPTVTAQAIKIPLCYRKVRGECVSEGTVVSGSQRVRQDKFTVSSQVFDREGEQALWVGSTRVQRNGASDRTLLAKLAGDVLRTLVRDGVVQAADRTQ